MKTKRLGNTTMEITSAGFGSWAIGGGNWAFGWGPQNDIDAIEAIRKAIDLGVNWIDTAAVYGLGHSEELVGQAIRDLAKKPYVFTKCSLVWDKNREVTRSLDPDSIQRECEASLTRLKMDSIDLYQIHWPLDVGIEKAWERMALLKEEGLVKNIGVSNFDVNQLKSISKIAPVSSLQPPYSLINRSVEAEILPYCLENNIGVIVYSPMGSGLLTGSMTRERIAAMPGDDWRSKSSNFREPKLSQNLALAEKLGEIGKRYSVPAGTVAVAWTLLNPAVTGAIVGARSAEQVEQILGNADFPAMAGEVQRLS